MSSSNVISPNEAELVQEVRRLRNEHPTLGATKLLGVLRECKPEWTISEKRLKKVMQQEGLMVVSKQEHASKSGTEMRHPISKLNSAVDVKKWTKKLEIKQFDAVRGKGLVAIEEIAKDEELWTEDPWVLTADWATYSGSTVGKVCSFCTCPLSMRKEEFLVNCQECTLFNRYCNRLCYTRAQSTYHPFLCEGQNPSCKPLLKILRESAWATPHALARVTGRVLSSLVSGGKGKGGRIAQTEDWSTEWSYFESLSGWRLLDKRRVEGSAVLPNEIELWKAVHKAYVDTFYTPPSSPTSPGTTRVHKVEIPEELSSKLFPFDAFMLNLGRTDLNREAFGGLYILHSHINHSCDSNITVRHLSMPAHGHTGVPVPGRVTIVAKRDIAVGEEITTSYVDPKLGYRERKLALLQWGIENCNCQRCEKEAVEAATLEDNGEKRDLAAELTNMFGVTSLQ